MVRVMSSLGSQVSQVRRRIRVVVEIGVGLIRCATLTGLGLACNPEARYPVPDPHNLGHVPCQKNLEANLTLAFDLRRDH